ncbi:hypothetical protein I4U23_029145 [Adineta vaga]|nr:hypothetical protein I4U23_029145 [Adineta vaga]
MLTKVRHLYYEEYSKKYDMPSEIKLYIDENGTFISHLKHEILQFVEIPLQDGFSQFVDFLDQQAELKEYFSFVPQTAYHTTLTILKEDTALKEETYLSEETVHKAKYLDTLTNAQKLLDKAETFTLCTGKQISSLDKKEIRLEIEYQSDFMENIITEYQNKWTERFPQLIGEHRKMFYITLAYQYKTIPNEETFNRLNTTIQNWQDFTFDVYLEPIEICSYSDLLAYKPILPE